METEEWRQVDDTVYYVSSFGRVKSIDHWVHRDKYGSFLKKGRIKSLHWSKKKFTVTCLVINGKPKSCSVHRLVAKAFIPNPENKPQVNHLDGSRKNNKVSNLEWCTHIENMEHAIKTGLIKTRKIKKRYRASINIGSKNCKAKLTESDIQEIRRLREKGVEYKYLANKFSCHVSNISNIVKRYTWKHVV